MTLPGWFNVLPLLGGMHCDGVTSMGPWKVKTHRANVSTVNVENRPLL